MAFKLTKKAKVILLIVLALVLVTLTLQGKGLRLPTNTGAPSDFDVSQQQLTGEFTAGANPDSSTLFQSPRRVADDGIYFQASAPTFDESNTEINKIRSKLPLYVNDMRTSGGVETSVSMYVRSGGRQDVLSIHVLGVNFNEGEASDNNPQYKAFVESLQRAKSELQKLGVDTTKLLVSFGTRQYEVDTANNWTRTSGTL